VAFTPTQIEAIRAGMHYGLTMVRVISPRNKMYSEIVIHV